MRRSYADVETRKIGEGIRSRHLPPSIQTTALRKLMQLNAAVSSHDLKAPPGNRPEALKGRRKGQHSIRINDQWRLCFVWTELVPAAVEIVDHH